MSSYDDIPYISRPHASTDPDRIAAIARLHGVTPPPPDTCRVLEIGCSHGTNLMALASARPGIEAVGLDPSGVQILEGKRRLEQIGLTNVKLVKAGVEEVDETWGKFDYILCHGVFSWVDDTVREAILRVCRENLSPNGLAYISYNTFPGWFQRLPVRELMMFHAQGATSAREKIARARESLDFLMSSLADPESEYAKVVRRIHDELANHWDEYVYHEYLAEHNDPLWFREFAAAVDANQLSYIGDADFWMNPGEGPQTGTAKGTDKVAIEQYADFFRNRTFRKSIVAHKSEISHKPASWTNVQSLRFDGVVRLESPIDLGRDVEVEFTGEFGVPIVTSEPLVKAAFQLMGEMTPHAPTFDELLTTARQILDREELPEAADRTALAVALLEQLSLGTIYARMAPDPFTTAIETRPRCTALARLEAQEGGEISTLRQSFLNVDDADRYLLRHLDGEHSLDALATAVMRGISDGRFFIQVDEAELEDQTPLGRCRAFVMGRLAAFAASGLLRAS